MYLVGADSLLEDFVQVQQLLGHHARVLGPDQVLDTLIGCWTHHQVLGTLSGVGHSIWCWAHSSGAGHTHQVLDTLSGVGHTRLVCTLPAR